jgi:hypothetical protein
MQKQYPKTAHSLTIHTILICSNTLDWTEAYKNVAILTMCMLLSPVPFAECWDSNLRKLANAPSFIQYTNTIFQ